jgi:uncharacterized protein YjaG (DUF416 family)
MIYAVEAAIFSTENQLPNLEFAVNHYGQPDVAMFDFTAMYAAENACRVIQRKGHKLMMTLVGDSLLEVSLVSISFLILWLTNKYYNPTRSHNNHTIFPTSSLPCSLSGRRDLDVQEAS